MYTKFFIAVASIRENGSKPMSLMRGIIKEIVAITPMQTLCDNEDNWETNFLWLYWMEKSHNTELYIIY